MNAPNLDLARMDAIIRKLADDTSPSAFTPEEQAVMRQMRENRETILAHLYAISKDATGRNDRGRKKIMALIRGVERICG